MKTLQLLDRNELARLLKTTPESISTQIYKGQEGNTIPFSIKLGSKRLWRVTTVEEWLTQKEQITFQELAAQKRSINGCSDSLKGYRPQNPLGIRLIPKK